MILAVEEVAIEKKFALDQELSLKNICEAITSK